MIKSAGNAMFLLTWRTSAFCLRNDWWCCVEYEDVISCLWATLAYQGYTELFFQKFLPSHLSICWTRQVGKHGVISKANTVCYNMHVVYFHDPLVICFFGRSWGFCMVLPNHSECLVLLVSGLCPSSYIPIRTQHLVNWICFCSEVKRWRASTQFSPLLF
jgi:hypothetical protein